MSTANNLNFLTQLLPSNFLLEFETRRAKSRGITHVSGNPTPPANQTHFKNVSAPGSYFAEMLQLNHSTYIVLDLPSLRARVQESEQNFEKYIRNKLPKKKRVTQIANRELYIFEASRLSAVRLMPLQSISFGTETAVGSVFRISILVLNITYLLTINERV